jgi:hypothetical protein
MTNIIFDYKKDNITNICLLFIYENNDILRRHSYFNLIIIPQNIKLFFLN